MTEIVENSSDFGNSQYSLLNQAGEGRLSSFSAASSPSTQGESTHPPRMVLFGTLYDGGREGHLAIVAHTPYSRAGRRLIDLDDEATYCIACIVDRMILPGIMGVPVSGDAGLPTSLTS